MQATRPLPPLNRASPAAPAASAARREASAQTPSTPAPLETSSATATSGEPAPATTVRSRPRVDFVHPPWTKARHVGVGPARSRSGPTTRLRRTRRRGGALALSAPPPSKRVELAQDDARLDRAVPVVDLEPDRGVDLLVLADAEAGAAEGDADRAVGAAVEAEARVLALLPHRPHVADPGRRHHQPHAGIAHPERRQLLQLLGQLEAEADAADDRVDPLRAQQVLGTEDRRRVGGEGGAEGVEVLRPQRQPRRRPVAAEALELLGACLQRRQQVEAGDAAARAAAAALAVERDDDHRAVVALDQPRGDDPDHAGMPALAGEDQPRGRPQLLGQLAQVRLCRRVDLALGRPPLGVGPAQLDRDLLRPTGIVAQQQLDPGVGPVQPPRGVDPRRQPERQVALVERRRLAPGRRHQRPQAHPATAADLRQPALDQRPVLADQRHHVGHRGKGHQVEVVLGGGVPRRAFARSSWGPHPRGRPQCASQLPGHCRATEVLERVARERRVEDRAGGQLRPWLVVVGDHHLHPQLLRQPHLGDGGDAAIDGQQQAGAALGEALDVLRGQPVAVRDPVGDEPIAVGAEPAQGRDHERRGADAVDVEVAMDRDPLTRLDRRRHQLDHLAHRAEGRRRVGLVGGEEGPRLLRRAVPAPHQRHRDRLGEADAFGDRAHVGVLVGLGSEGFQGGGHPARLGRQPDTSSAVP